MSGATHGFDVENEVAFAALGGWEEALRHALQDYCDHCRSLSPGELALRPHVRLDVDFWADPQVAAFNRPFTSAPFFFEHSNCIDAGARYLAGRIRTGRVNPYALLGALARGCER